MDGRLVGTTRYVPITGGGLPPSPVSGMVTVQDPATGQDITLPFVIGASGVSSLEDHHLNLL